VVLAIATPLSGQEPADAFAATCDAAVVDAAGLFGADIADVEGAAARLAEAGVTVRVRTVTAVGSLDALRDLEDTVVRRCGSWSDSTGQFRRGDMIAVFLTGDRFLDIVWGSRFDEALGTRADGIRARDMAPDLAAGDYAAGIAAGLDVMLGAIEAERSIRSPVTPSPVAALPIAPAAQAPPSPWPVRILVIALVLAAAAGAVVFVLKGAKERRLRRAARQEALATAQAVNERVIGASTTLPALAQRVESTMRLLDEPDAEALRRSLAEAKRLYGMATGGIADLGVPASDPEREDLSAEEYETIQRRFESVLEHLHALQRVLDETTERHDALGLLIREAPARVTAAESAIADADGRIAAIAAQDYLVDDAKRELKAARAMVETGRDLVARQRHGRRLADALDEARRGIDGAVATAERLPVRRKTIETGSAELSERVSGVRELLDRGADAYERMSAAYAASALEPVTGNVAEAGKRLAAIRTAIAEARDAAGMQTQEWSRGESSLERARAWTDEAESCLRSVLALERNITESESAIDTEISAAESDIARTREYIRTFDPDVPEELDRELHEAAALLEQAKSERKQEKPDILSAARSVRSAHDHVDRILESARSARETAERLRASAQSAFRSAAAAISTAAEYLEDHSADVGGNVRELVAEAEHILVEAGQRVEDAARAEDFDATACRDAVGRAERAEEQANEAYRIARAEFLEAESRREDQRRAALLLLQQQEQQRRNAILSSSVSSSQNSFGSWGSGASSFGGRSGGAFGGGGRSGGSFGGGGRSGGRF
jgi:uncharacterized membrane protein YgcG/ABC-type transporter Mla subunit MlaD